MENMINLVKENTENKKRFILSVICGVITMIAAFTFAMLAPFVKIPTAARIVLIVAAVATAVVGIGAAAVLDADASDFECPYCKTLFVPECAGIV